MSPNAKASPGRTRLPFFYGWVIAGAGFVATVLTGLMNQGFSSYLGPLGKEFGWSRTQLAGPRSLVQAEGALLGPVNGYAVDKFGPRSTVTFGMLLLGSGLILFGFVHNLWEYFAVNVLIGVGTSFAGVFPFYVALNNWFRRKRTTAMAAMQMGISTSALIAVPVLVWGQAHFGWRHSAMACGVVVWALGIPVATLLKRSPEPMGLLPDGDKPGEVHAAATKKNASTKKPESSGVDFTVKEAVRTRAFWSIAVSNGLNGLVMQAVTVHQFLHMEQGVGLTRATAAGAISFLAVFNVIGRVAGGYLGDRYTKRQMLMLALICTTVSLVPFALAKSLWPVLVFSALYGFGWGMRAPIQFSMVGEYFGRTSFGRIQGWIQSAAVPLSIIGPIFAGVMADWQGDYVLTYLILAGIAGLAAAAYFSTQPPKAPIRVAAQQPAGPAS